MKPPAAMAMAIALVAAFAGVGVLVATAVTPGRAAATSSIDPAPIVPSWRDPPVVDGALEDAAWRGSVLRSGPFVREDGARAAPHTEARLGWGDGKLFVALYAADIDVASADRMRVEVATPSRTVSFDVGPNGAASAPPGVTVAAEADEATVDDARDRDEEWTAEAAIDLTALGIDAAPGARLSVRLSRCDVAPGAPPRCTSWRPAGGAVALGRE